MAETLAYLVVALILALVVTVGTVVPVLFTRLAYGRMAAEQLTRDTLTHFLGTSNWAKSFGSQLAERMWMERKAMIPAIYEAWAPAGILCDDDAPITVQGYWVDCAGRPMWVEAAPVLVETGVMGELYAKRGNRYVAVPVTLDCADQLYTKTVKGKRSTYSPIDASHFPMVI